MNAIKILMERLKEISGVKAILEEVKLVPKRTLQEIDRDIFELRKRMSQPTLKIKGESYEND